MSNGDAKATGLTLWFFCIFFYFVLKKGDFMTLTEFKDSLDRFPVIATVHASELSKALKSPAEILVHMKADLLTIKEEATEGYFFCCYFFENIIFCLCISGFYVKIT